MNQSLAIQLSALTLALAWLAAPAKAADFRVAPVLLEPLPNARTSALTLINEEQRPLQAQIRVLRWSFENGREVLVPTQDVVASPPQATLAPGQHYTVRLVRVNRAPVAGEESYRVLVDEVPDPAGVRPGSVDLVLRQSVPLFFSDTPQRTAQVAWSVAQDGGRSWLVARNTGNRRLRLADVQVTAGGSDVLRHPGLFGYVLAGSETRWPLPAPAAQPLQIRAATDTGGLEATVALESRR